MSKQHIPTACPSDTDLLNALQATTRNQNLWVCRESVTRGMIIHEITTEDAEALVRKAYPDVRKALAAGLGLVKKET